MRQVFSSPRLENVERLAQMLREQGIEAKITNGRSYKGSRRGNFSYREHGRSGTHPAVWVVNSEDQPRAREILRDMGLLDSGRSPTSYLPTPAADRDDDLENAAKRRTFKLRAALMAGIAVAIGFGVFATRKPAPPASQPAAAQAPRSTVKMTPHGATWVVETPTALAAMLIDTEVRANEAKLVCLAVDGADPVERVFAQLQSRDSARLLPRSACPTGAEAASALTIDIREYRTDGSNVGTVQLQVADVGRNGQPRVQQRTLEVERHDIRWQVNRVVM